MKINDEIKRENNGSQTQTPTVLLQQQAPLDLQMEEICSLRSKWVSWSFMFSPVSSPWDWYSKETPMPKMGAPKVES